MPGVLILEALAQASGLLVFKTPSLCPPNEILYLFVGIDKARFKKPVIPGDVMVIDVKLIQSKKEVYKFDASCKVDDAIVCSAELLRAIREKNDS